MPGLFYTQFCPDGCVPAGGIRGKDGRWYHLYRQEHQGIPHGNFDHEGETELNSQSITSRLFRENLDLFCIQVSRGAISKPTVKQAIRIIRCAKQHGASVLEYAVDRLESIL